jgi:GntR family transcriptional regulator, rspAB operon transcriptional repressor
VVAQESTQGLNAPKGKAPSGRAFPVITLDRAISPRTPQRISDSVYEALTEAVRDLRLLPGEPISETSVAEWLNVSRSPVREAIARLVDLGLVVVKPQVGSYIAPISLQEVEEAAFIRSALETSAFKRAIRDGVPDTTEIQRHVDMNRGAAEAGDVETFFETDEKLHQNVFELAGLGKIWDVVRRTKIQLDRLRRLSLPRVISNPVLVEEHQLIVDCLRTQNEKLGVEVIERHATRIFHTIEDHRSLYPDYFSDEQSPFGNVAN